MVYELQRGFLRSHTYHNLKNFCYKKFLEILPTLTNIEFYLSCPSFIKLAALANVSEKSYPNLNSKLNADIRVISKSLKYSVVLRPCRMESFQIAATKIIEKAFNPNIKADCYLKLAKSILKISPQESVELALKAFNKF